MSDRIVQAGQTIKLRARFRDDLDIETQATNVFVHIYEPNEVVDFNDTSNAIVQSGVPTYLGEGIFEYEYILANNATAGTWQDAWEGDLPSQSLEAIFAFTVMDSGAITVVDNQLHNNNVVEIIINGISATDGALLSEPIEVEFLTTTSPSYTNLRKVRLEVGSYLIGLPDDVIQTAILEASIDADAITFSPGVVNSKLFEHARREYVTCQVGNMLLNNMSSGSLKAKTLADLHVEYDTKGIQDAMKKLEDCVWKWKDHLMTGGGAKTAAQPSGVVKGSLDPDRPIVSRSWQNIDGTTSDRTPIANDRVKPLNSRRHLRTHRKRWW